MPTNWKQRGQRWMNAIRSKNYDAQYTMDALEYAFNQFFVVDASRNPVEALDEAQKILELWSDIIYDARCKNDRQKL